MKDYLNSLRGQIVFCKALNADVEIRKQGIKKFMSFTSNPVKLQIAYSLLDIIRNGKVFKHSQSSYADNELSHGVKYHYLRTPFNIGGVEYGARVVIREDMSGKYIHNAITISPSVIREDMSGKFHYDLQIRDSLNAIIDSLNQKENPSVPNFHKVLAVSDCPNILKDINTLCQEHIFDDIGISVKSDYVLNLVVFDKYGNKI